MAGDEKIVADRVYQILSAKHALKPAEPVKPPVANLSGRWDVEIKFAAGKSTHVIHVTQEGNRLDGAHRGDFIERDLTGTISGDAVRFSSVQRESHGEPVLPVLGQDLRRYDVGSARYGRVSGRYLDSPPSRLRTGVMRTTARVISMWRTHSCVPRRYPCRRLASSTRTDVEMSLDTARTSACATSVTISHARRHGTRECNRAAPSPRRNSSERTE